LEEEWSPVVKRNFATYSSLPPGQYTFQVEARSGEGVWNEKPAIVTFEIRPPFWQTWWFYSASGATLVLGIAGFIKIRERNLRRTKRVLAQKVRERTKQVVEQKEEIERKNRDINDSINYASRIQASILVAEETLHQFSDSYFILFKPKEAVSGDFYWAERQQEKYYFTVSDCTGHGVPGAMVSLLGSEALNRCVHELKIEQPDQIMNKLTGLVEAHFEKSEGLKDGMDLGLCCWNPKQQTLSFSGANNPVYIITEPSPELLEQERVRFWSTAGDSDKGLLEIKGDPQPIGKFAQREPFTRYQLKLAKGDMVYLFSDGYPDQFGGPKGKKFMYKQFRNLFLNIQDKPMEEQKETLNQTIEDWMAQNDEEQIDDICVLGVKIA
jgi:serine phosphatase RsbU (regulator of sigma subunit)